MDLSSFESTMVEALRNDMEARLTIPDGISDPGVSGRGDAGFLAVETCRRSGGRESTAALGLARREALFCFTGTDKACSKISVASSAVVGLER